MEADRATSIPPKRKSVKMTIFRAMMVCSVKMIDLTMKLPKKNGDLKKLPKKNGDLKVPYGRGKVVKLDSSEQKPLVDFDATNNRAYQSGALVFNSERENTREASKRRCMTESALSLVDSTTRISSTDVDAPDYGADLARAYQRRPTMFNSEKKDTREGFNGECLTKSVLSDDDDSTKRKALPDCTSLASFSELTSEDIDDNYDFDDGAGMLPDLVDEFVAGLLSSCGDERIVVSTTNHRELHAAALPPLVKMDTYIHTVSPQPIALPGGGEIVQLESIQQKSFVDFDATNNRAYQSGVLMSSEKKNMIQAYKGRWESLIQRTEKDIGEGLNEECLTKCALKKDDSTEQNSVDPRWGRVHLHSMEREQPATFEEFGTDQENGGIVSDLLRFVREKEFYKRVGKTWKRGYLLHNPPCTDISSLMAYMANCLEFEIYNLDLTGLSSIEQLTNVLVSIRNCSLIAIKDFDQWIGMLPNLKSESSSSSCWPIGLPDGRHIVVLDPLEQSTKNVAHAAWVDQFSPTVSLPEKKMVRKTLKRKCRTRTVIFESHEEHFGRRYEGSAKSFCATRIGRKHGTNPLSTVKHNHKQHGIHQWPFRQKWATRKGYSAGGKRSFEISCLSMIEKLNSRLQFIHTSQCAKADESGPTVSNSEKGRMREALKREPLKDLRQHFGARRKDAAKGLCDSLAWKSFEVLDSLSLGKQSNSIRHLARRRTLTHKHCVRLKKSQDLPRSLLSDFSGEFAAQSTIGLPHGGHIPSPLEKKIVRKTLKRKSRTMSVLSLEDHQQHVDWRWEDEAKFVGVKRICRQLAIDRGSTAKRIRRQHGFCRWPFKQSAIGLPDGHIVSLSNKKIARKTLKRKCRTMSVLSLEYHQHVDDRWEDAVKSLGGIGAHAAKRVCRQLVIHRVSTAKHIHRQPGIHRWPFQQSWATMKGYPLVDERPVEVIYLCMDGKLVLRLQLIYISWLGRFSPRPSALLGGEIVGPIALSSSEFGATNNRAHLVRQDQSGSSASHSKKKRTRETKNGKGINTRISLEDLQQQFGSTRKDAAERLCVSESTLKRICRHHGIMRWPNPTRKKAPKPPDPHERNTGQIEMENQVVGHLHEPTEVWKPPDPHERITGRIEMENDVVGHLHEPIEILQEDFYGPILLNKENGSMAGLSETPTDWDPDFVNQFFLEETEVGGSHETAFQVIDESTLSTAYPHPNPVVFMQPQVASTHIVRGNMGIPNDQNMGIPNDQRNSLASLAETRLEGHGTGSTCSNLAMSQPMLTLSQMMPPLPSSQDTRSVKLKVYYGLDKVKFRFPVTSGINELKGQVAMRFNLERDSFNMTYDDEDEEGDKILISIDEDLRDYLSSSVNPVIKLWVVNKVTNPMNLCESCGGSLK